MSNELNENIIIFYFAIIVISLRSQNAKIKYKEKNYQIKTTRKDIVNVDDDEEYVNEEIILQDYGHDNNIDLDEVDQPI